MIKLNNPYQHIPGYNCFACSPSHPAGLRLEFYDNGDEIICTWLPDNNFEGYQGVLHGGIQATLLDEAGSWLVNTKLKTAGVTSSMKINYLKPVRIGNGEIKIVAKLIECSNKTAEIKTQLFNTEEVLCAEATVEYFIYPEEIAKRKFRFPGHEAFYNNDPEAI